MPVRVECEWWVALSEPYPMRDRAYAPYARMVCGSNAIRFD